MANLKAKIRANPNKIVAQTLKLANVSLADLTDVDTASLADGAMIQYNAGTSKFKMTNSLDGNNLIINSGTY